MKKIITLLLALIICSSFALTACSNDSDSVVKKDITAGKPSIYVEPKSFKSTDKVIAFNGSSNYSIIIPESPTAMEKYAAEELQTFLKESTGATLNIYTDAGIDHDNTQKFLSVGQTVLLEAQTDIVIDFDVLGESGATIMTKGDTVYMSGADEYGTLYSVYKFLEYQIGFVAYSTDCVYYEYFNELKLLDFNYQYVPLIAKTNGGEEKNSEMTDELARMYLVGSIRTGPSELFEGPIFDGYFCHTNMYFLSQTEYPHLYKNNQICYTNPEALQVFSENLYNLFVNNPSMDRINLGVNDFPTSCDCENCLEQTAIYNGGGVLLRFCNNVAEYIDNKFKEQGITRKIDLVPLMYYHYIEPPVQEDENGNYVKDSKGNCIAVDDTCYPRTGDVSVKVMFTPILSCYHHNFGAPCETNIQNRDWLLGWKALTKEFYMYSYGANFPGYHTYFNNVAYMSNQYKWYYENDIRFVYNHEECEAAETNVFKPLKMFIKGRLGWNPTLDVQELVHDFMVHYYGEAGESVEKYYYELTDHIKYVYTLRDTECLLPLTTISAAVYWPRNTLLSFESHLNNAMLAIKNTAYTEGDKAEYSERINKELFLVKYNLYMYYANYYTNSELSALKAYVDENIVKDGYSPTPNS